jgi:hypothetical protein
MSQACVIRVALIGAIGEHKGYRMLLGARAMRARAGCRSNSS